ncbi:MBL fold metallo-hydrolase [Desulfovibrio litoralis]|uniref:Glyoxylase, beta-lactamase superfamily II n=1 Tax=Desulfovibrio litoralis DSM 11393 TaxID=1121455 RepID=A0A1M7SB39_9BACT|nr:MBL fold metallo-hydrolase [Desulfovibrio litoralis]SHN55442.1 Glyoxylase, beta-lactamase superfamily II [Desulfovibrio litoralis DSM 11393]
MSFELETLTVGPLDVNCYLLSHQGKAIAIDAGGNAEQISSVIKEKKLELTCILNTHLHFDHCYANAALQKEFNVPILAGQLDAVLLESELGLGGAYGFEKVEPYKVEYIGEGNRTLLNTECKVLLTPGHTPGSLSYYFPKWNIVFTGDVLFYRSVGRTDFPGGSSKVLRQSIKEVLFALPDNTDVYPGHGDPTNIGDEKLNNPYYGQFARI